MKATAIKVGGHKVRHPALLGLAIAVAGFEFVYPSGAVVLSLILTAIWLEAA